MSLYCKNIPNKQIHEHYECEKRGMVMHRTNHHHHHHHHVINDSNFHSGREYYLSPFVLFISLCIG